MTALILARLEALPKARETSSGFTAQCPAHADRNPSLSWNVVEDGRVLLCCHAGCSAESVVAALGCSMVDLFEPSPGNGHRTAARTSKPAAGRTVRTKQYIVRDVEGRSWTRHRKQDADGRKVAIWSNTGVEPDHLCPWGSENATGWPADEPVIVAEGEATAEALLTRGWHAVATFGASYRPIPEALRALDGRDLILWPDADDSGRAHMLDMAGRLAPVARSLRWIEPPADRFSGWDAADADADLTARLIAEAGSLPGSGATKPSGMAAAGIDAADLLELELPPLRMIVPDLLPEGTTILAAPPKVGKSCLMYQIVTEVAVGGELFGRRVEPGSCLYLALEDGQRRGQDRLRAALAGRTLQRGRLEIRWAASRIGEGLETEIVAWLDDHADAAVVAIDTLQRVRPRTNGRRNAYEVDVDDLSRLQGLFRDRPVALVIVHHSRKEAGDDFLASVNGTYGITGSADTTIVVRRKRQESFGYILVTGRDVPEAEIGVRFDGMLWRETPLALAEASFARTDVYATIEERGPVWPAQIATLTGLERTSVQHMVTRLVEQGAVSKTVKGYRAR